ncbi:MAG: hypothetical protein QOJ40_1347 [Verrucomicrobiota bacterium]
MKTKAAVLFSRSVVCAFLPATLLTSASLRAQAQSDTNDEPVILSQVTSQTITVVDATAFTSSSCVPAPAGLVSWWRAENDLLDGWDSNNGTTDWLGSYPMTYVAGKVGRAFSIGSGASSSIIVRVPDAPSLRLTNGLTIEGWVFSTGGSALQTILAKSDSFVRLIYPPLLPPAPTNVSYHLGTTNGLLFLALSRNGSSGSNAVVFASQPLPESQWTHIAGSYDGAALRLYTNGTLAAAASYSGGIFPGTASLGLGGIPDDQSPYGSDSWSGYLDEISLYNRALSDGEIAAIHNADASGKCLVPPMIVVQPQSQAIPIGEDVLFSVPALGTKPFKYQWRFNGERILGATNATLLLEKIQSNRIGSYSVVLSNALGFALSSNALLSLLPAPACISPPAGIVSWWPADNTGVDAIGTNNAIVSFPATYATGKVGRAFSQAFQSPVSIRVANSPSLNFGSNADFSIEGWIKAFPVTNPPPPLGAPPPPRFGSPPPNLIIVNKRTAGKLELPYAIGPDLGYALSLNNGRIACWLGSAVTNPFITNSSTYISPGPNLRDAMFHHIALSLNRGATNGGNLYVDGQVVLTFNPIARRGSLSNTNGLLIGFPADTLNDGAFNGLIDELAVYNRALSASEILAIRQAGAAGKCKVQPFIAQQPASLHVLPGSNATFTVVAGGTGTLHYQWRFNTEAIAGATSSAFTRTNVGPSNAGLYSVLVTNSFGSLLSSNAALILNHAPAVLCQTVLVAAGSDCVAMASVDNGSFDPDGDPMTRLQTPPGPYPLGTNLVTLTATDSWGASNSCNSLVIVLDQTPPAITCPPNIVANNDLNLCGATVSFPLPVASDLCSTVTNITCLPPPGSFFPVGVTTVQCSATEAAGNTGTCSFTVTIRDTQAPTITCPADMVVTNAHDAWTSVVSFNPAVSDNCPDTPLLISNPSSGSAFGLGTNNVSCVAVDLAGNSNQCAFHIIVRPGNVPPVPIIQVAPLFHISGNTNLLVISPNGSNATLVFDGSASYDLDDTNFFYYWYQGTNLFSTNVVAVRLLGLGTNEITLKVDDTFPLGTNSASVTLQVISASDAVGLIIQLLNQSNLARNQPLLASLNAALRAFERGSLQAGANELAAFQNKVQAQVAPLDAVLAGNLSSPAQQIIDALANDGPDGRRAGPFQSINREPNGKVKMRFAGQRGQTLIIEASSNLLDWQRIGVAKDNGDGSFDFEDTQAAKLSHRFYRLARP